MATIAELGRFLPGGQWVAALSLENTDYMKLAEDGFLFTPGDTETTSVVGAGPFDGETAVSSRQANGAASFQWIVRGTSGDDAIQNMELLIQTAANAGTAQWLKVQASTATKPSYLDLRAAGILTPKYAFRLFEQKDAILVDGTFAVAPKVYGPPCTVRDEFSFDTIADYTLWTAPATLSVAGGALVPSSTARKIVQYTARGYTHSDNSVTIEVALGAGAVAGNRRAVLAMLDKDNYLYADIDGSNLIIGKRDLGVDSSLASTAQALTASTTRWLTLRMENSVLKAEYYTAQPVAGGTGSALTTLSYTLAAANLTKFGSPVEGGFGLDWTPASTNERINSFHVRPWTREALVQPFVTAGGVPGGVIQMRGQIPGTRPADVGVEYTVNGGGAAPWFGIGWTKRTGNAGSGSGARAPFGVFDATSEGATGASLSVKTSGTWANGLGGNMQGATVAGAQTYECYFTVDPSLMVDADPANPFLLSVEVWGSFQLNSGLTALSFIEFHRDAALNAVGGVALARYTLEYGQGGRGAVLPAGVSNGRQRFLRLGTLEFEIDPDLSLDREVVLQIVSPASASGDIGFDYAWLVPSRSRAISPTGEPDDSGYYPKFADSANPFTKRVNADLRGHRLVTAPSFYARDNGLTGSPITMPPGNIDLTYIQKAVVPDDPTLATTKTDVAPVTTSMHLDVQPCWAYMRS